MEQGAVRRAAGLTASGVVIALAGGCTQISDDARALARHTCDAVEHADANPPQYMLRGFQNAEAAGVSESDFRDALVEECGMEPPARSRLEDILGE